MQYERMLSFYKDDSIFRHHSSKIIRAEKKQRRCLALTVLFYFSDKSRDIKHSSNKHLRPSVSN